MPHRSAFLIVLVGVAASLCRGAEAVSTTDETPAPPYVTLMLARDPAVAHELKLDAKQTERLAAAVAEVDSPFWVLRDVPLAQCREKLDALDSELCGQLTKILTAPQSQRFDQIFLQARGFRSLASPDMGKRLGLSADQTARIA